MATKYAWANISFTGAGVVLSSTDAELLDELAAGVKKFIPSTEVLVKQSDLAGEKFSVSLVKLRTKEYEVEAWLVKQLCLQGWEPFHFGGRQYHFRRAY